MDQAHSVYTSSTTLERPPDLNLAGGLFLGLFIAFHFFRSFLAKSWMRSRRRKPVRCIDRLWWETLAEEAVRRPFRSHLRQTAVQVDPLLISHCWRGCPELLLQ